MQNLITPTDFQSLSEIGENWRSQLFWPARFADAVGPLKDIRRRYLATVMATEDRDAQMVMLMGHYSTSTILAASQYALWIDAAEKQGIRLIGYKILDYLSGIMEEDQCPPTTFPLPSQSVKFGMFGWLRRIVRTASWTPITRLPKAIMQPDGIALNHNSLLRAYLSQSKYAARTAYPFDFDLSQQPLDTGFVKKIDYVSLATKMAAEVTDHLALSPFRAARLKIIARQILLVSYEEATEMLARVRSIEKLPRIVFSGTGGKLMSRALGLEVMRRGGEAIRCDHGGSSVLLDLPSSRGLAELSVSTKFITATPAASKAAGLVGAQKMVRPMINCALEGHTGDPGFDAGPHGLARSQNSSGRRRAMYVSTVFYGFQQVLPPAMPATLYLDWQIRLAEMLQRFPVELICKPHPGAFKPPAQFDLSRVAPVTLKMFEEAVANADVLIYDYPATTTLAVGLCTDRPIVLIDHGTMHFSADLEDAMRLRCKRVVADYDSRGRPVIDEEELQDAVCGGPDHADPTTFRALFLGEPE